MYKINNKNVGNEKFNSEIIDLVEQNKYLYNDIFKDKEVVELLDSIKNVNADQILSFTKEIENNFGDKITDLVLVGIGGSSLGVRAFVQPKMLEKTLKYNCHFMENIDPVSILNVLNSINANQSIFIFISKSGNTIETVSQAEFCINWLKNQNLKPKKHCISITSLNQNDLLKISQINNIKAYSWQGNIGGRFSAFSTSTLLPLALLGIDLNKIKKAGQEVEFINGMNGAVINHLLWQKNYDVNVLMPYSDQLSSFAAWYRQLWAESVGKEGFGSIPEFSIGTIDQHSMLQMYLGGKKNKFFTLIEIDSKNTIFSNTDSQKLSFSIENSSLIGKKNVNFANMLKMACRATTKSLADASCPVRIITIPFVDEYFVAKMMIDFIFETIFAASLATKYLNLQISPFGQPNVEKSKYDLIDAIKSSTD